MRARRRGSWRCARSPAGRALLADAWGRAYVDTTATRRLFWASQHVRDARLLRAMQAAADAALPLTYRYAAPQATATLADQTLYSPYYFPYEREGLSCPSALPLGDPMRGDWHVVHDQAGAPLGRGAPAAIARFLEQRAATDPDARIRRAAGFLRACLRPRATPQADPDA